MRKTRRQPTEPRRFRFTCSNPYGRDDLMAAVPLLGPDVVTLEFDDDEWPVLRFHAPFEDLRIRHQEELTLDKVALRLEQYPRVPSRRAGRTERGGQRR